MAFFDDYGRMRKYGLADHAASTAVRS